MLSILYRNRAIIVLLLLSSCKSLEEKVKSQNQIIDKYYTNCAKTHSYTISMNDWQQCLDKGLKQDKTIARLWQEKAMPYFKARKYEIGMKYLNKAVKYDKQRWLDYRAFIKCIFVKNYKSAIEDFNKASELLEDGYIMDHSYDFYLGLCYLGLTQYDKAEELFSNYVDKQFAEDGEQWINPTSLFYLGISLYELEKYEEAIVVFDRALILYNNFSDVKFYKSVCLMKLGREVQSSKIYDEYIGSAEKVFI